MSSSKTFEEFHKRKAGEPVYPFEGLENGKFRLDVKIPDFVCLGRAVRVLYDSDKWNDVGDVVGYYHTHGPEDGKYVFSKGNQVKFFVAAPYAAGLGGKAVRLPVEWPDEVVPLGACSGWVAGDDELYEGSCSDAVLVCSPYGWLDSSDEHRVFLAIIEIGTGIIEAIIDGPDLIVTEHGIEG